MGVIGLDSSPEKYRDILNNFGITRFDDLFTLLIKESLGLEYPQYGYSYWIASLIDFEIPLL